jgi:hydrogenase maturation protein HypF
LLKAYSIQISGIVQGVGFRPFVLNLARRLGVKGWVNNTGDGISIHAEGDKERLNEFYRCLQAEKPLLAQITTSEKSETSFVGYKDFRIIRSTKSEQNKVLISPDIATCPECLTEMFDSRNRRFNYPFINCTNCGPRYSIILDRPYDRERTTMSDFTMCKACQQEYSEPTDRRFHAQPTACWDCGPSLKLLNAQGLELGDWTIGVELLKSGAIIALKGLGGFHLACDAYNEQAVARLRELKERGAKPFALMAKDLETAEKEVLITPAEKRVLSSASAPIVILPRKNKSRIPAIVAPGLHTLGIMLPHTPIHHLLFNKGLDFLVMTSANLSGKPLIYENENALKELKGLADYFLVHNRDIYHPCDDSVVQLVGERTIIFRRARGYVPVPLFLEQELADSIAALGGEKKNAFCLAAKNKIFPGQYIGDIVGLESLERFKQEFNSFQKVANISPKIVACDKHPDYSTTKYAQELNLPVYQVQHHHAHLVSVMAEHGLEKPMLGLICDGTGYGEDGKIWGFEFLFGNAKAFERRAHLEYLPLPGGDTGAKKPLRVAYAYCRCLLSKEEWSRTEKIWSSLSARERSILDSQLKNNIQIFATSSAGRLFDVVSALLGICTAVTYEGQAAIELESRALSWQNRPSALEAVKRIKQEALNRLKDCTISLAGGFQTSKLIAEYNKTVVKSRELYPIWLDFSSGSIELKVNKLLQRITHDYLTPKPEAEIAFRFHYSLAVAMLETAMIIGVEDRKIVIGGGVFQNKLLMEILLFLSRQVQIEVIHAQKMPIGDGGLAVGQILIANELMKKNSS